MRKISVLIAKRHTTSITLEDEFYDTLKEIAKTQNRRVSDIVTEVDSKRGTRSLSSAVRVYILKEIKSRK